uniref:Putative secreted protein n=1 Tax=Anopheles darlingi TaxID=43151 RepID=A0A2M4DPM7_ANODA
MLFRFPPGPPSSAIVRWWWFPVLHFLPSIAIIMSTPPGSLYVHTSSSPLVAQGGGWLDGRVWSPLNRAIEAHSSSEQQHKPLMCSVFSFLTFRPVSM